MFFPPLLVFLLALVAYILWWLRSNLFKISFGNKIFLFVFLCDAFEKLLCYHVYLTLWSCFGGKKKWRLCRSLWTVFKRGRLSPGDSLFDGFILFSSFFGARSSFWSTCNSICWCWHWRRKRIHGPHLFVFLLLLKQYAFCSISQEWCSLLFQARNFPRIVCFKLRLTLFW